MKQKFVQSSYVIVFLLVALSLIAAISNTSARPLPLPAIQPPEGADDQKLHDHIHQTMKQVSLPKSQDTDNIHDSATYELMGAENCENGDEECLNRRILSEAHLDYIYTQHHKP